MPCLTGSVVTVEVWKNGCVYSPCAYGFAYSPDRFVVVSQWQESEFLSPGSERTSLLDLL